MDRRCRKGGPKYGVAVLLLCMVAALTGCSTVGPEYVKPTLELPKNWKSAAQAGLPTEQERLAGWWKTLDDPLLTELMEVAAADNLSIKQAVSRVRSARLQRARTKASLFPALDSSGSARKSERHNDGGQTTQAETYAAGFDAGWELDLFGGVRRSVEAAERDTEARMEELHDVVASLLAETALNYIDLRTYQQRLALAKSNVELQQQTWELLEAASRAGSGDALAVAQARYNLESSKAKLPSLEAGINAAMNRLAVLTGKPAGALHEKLNAPATLPVPSVEMAVGVPADILRQRPDIRRSERELAAQTSRIGVAEAELYPRFTLIGSIGLEAVALDKLISTPDSLWSIGPSISWPVFDAGSIRNNIKVQGELQQQALLTYEETVLAALEEVENALVAYAKEQQRLSRLEEASSSARLAANLAEHQYVAGVTSFSSVLDAQRSLLSFEDQMVESQGTVLTGLVRLYKALGGGWQTMSPAISMND